MVHGTSGHTLKRRPSLWERSTSTAWMPLAHDTEDREAGKNREAGALNRYGARSWESSERHAQPHERMRRSLRDSTPRARVSVPSSEEENGCSLLPPRP